LESYRRNNKTKRKKGRNYNPYNIHEELDLEIRNKIYHFILKYPGLHLSELSRRLNIPKSTLFYHINYLIKHDLLISKSRGKFIRYYITNGVANVDKSFINLLRNRTTNHILLIFLFNMVSSRTEISYILEKDPTTIAYHLKKLRELDLIEPAPKGKGFVYRVKEANVMERSPKGREVLLRLKNPEAVWNAYVNYQHSLFDRELIKPILEIINQSSHEGMPNKIKSNSSVIDNIIDLFNEVIPIPIIA
jgi:DNA-binding transcriptional ArsR family regulator